MKEEGTSGRSSLHRLAIRREGNTICAWFAEVGTMQDAKLLGTMAVPVAVRWPDVFEAFKAAMALALTHMVELVEGEVGALEEREAPPAERGRGAGSPGVASKRQPDPPLGTPGA